MNDRRMALDKRKGSVKQKLSLGCRGIVMWSSCDDEDPRGSNSFLNHVAVELAFHQPSIRSQTADHDSSIRTPNPSWVGERPIRASV